MTAFPGPGINRPPQEGHPAQLDLYAHIEGLCSEEDRILETAEHERTEEEHARLHEIAELLDRIWERLRRRGKPRS